MTRRVLAIAAIVCAGLWSPARAEMMISFDPNGPPAGGSPQEFFVGVGEQVLVPLFVFTPDNDLVTTDVGLISAGVRVSYVVSGTNASVNNISDIVLASQWDWAEFNATYNDPANGIVEMLGTVGVSTPAVKGTAILIGTIAFTGNAAGDVTDLRTGDISIVYPLGEDAIVDNNFNGWDAEVFANGTMARITTVPEPSSILLALSGLGLLGLVVVTKRRR